MLATSVRIENGNYSKFLKKERETKHKNRKIINKRGKNFTRQNGATEDFCCFPVIPAINNFLLFKCPFVSFSASRFRTLSSMSWRPVSGKHRPFRYPCSLPASPLPPLPYAECSFTHNGQVRTAVATVKFACIYLEESLDQRVTSSTKRKPLNRRKPSGWSHLNRSVEKMFTVFTDFKSNETPIILPSISCRPATWFESVVG